MVSAFEGAASKYEELSPVVATASAQSQIRELGADFSRSKSIEGNLAEFIDAQTDVSIVLGDIKTILLKAGMEYLVPLLKDVFSPFLKDHALPFFEKFLESFLQLKEDLLVWQSGNNENVKDIVENARFIRDLMKKRERERNKVDESINAMDRSMNLLRQNLNGGPLPRQPQRRNPAPKVNAKP